MARRALGLLLGRNGVGKTTCLRSLMGLTPPRDGEVRFRNQPILGLQQFEIARLGIGYVPEDRRVFPDLTVRDNLEIGIIKGRSDAVSKSIAHAFESSIRNGRSNSSACLGGHSPAGSSSIPILIAGR